MLKVEVMPTLLKNFISSNYKWVHKTARYSNHKPSNINERID